eukprot:1329617-Rhodomonas_salina.1
MAEFNGNIANWDVDGNIANWDFSAVNDMRGMFYQSSFTCACCASSPALDHFLSLRWHAARLQNNLVAACSMSAPGIVECKRSLVGWETTLQLLRHAVCHFITPTVRIGHRVAHAERLMEST